MNVVWTKGELLFILLSTVKQISLLSASKVSYVLERRMGLLYVFSPLPSVALSFLKRTTQTILFKWEMKSYAQIYSQLHVG